MKYYVPLSNLWQVIPIVMLCLSCSSSQIESYQESWAMQIRLDSFTPGLVTQGTQISIKGDGFVGTELGTSRLIMDIRDQSNPSGEFTRVTELLNRESRQEMTTVLSPGNFERLCPFSAMDLSARTSIETVSATSGQVYQSVEKTFNIQCQRTLTPVLETVVLHRLMSAQLSDADEHQSAHHREDLTVHVQRVFFIWGRAFKFLQFHMILDRFTISISFRELPEHFFRSHKSLFYV